MFIRIKYNNIIKLLDDQNRQEKKIEGKQMEINAHTYNIQYNIYGPFINNSIGYFVNRITGNLFLKDR